jgi:periplasmic divalent cation tolerance protein
MLERMAGGDQADSSAPDSVVCLLTTPTTHSQPIATALVERRLAACVNVVESVLSTYRWDGRVEHDEESLLVVKSTRHAVPAIEGLLREIHPYDTFELIALDVVAGSADYLRWIAESIGERTSADGV